GVQAEIPVRRSQHNSHLPDLAQELLVAQVRHIVRRVVEIDIVIIVAVKEALDVERSAHGNARRNQIRMAQGKIQRVIAAKTASGNGNLRSLVLPLQVRQKLVGDVTLVLHMPRDACSRRHALVVPALAVDAVHAEQLKRSRFQFPGQRADHSRVFILEKTPHGGRKNEDRLPGMPKHQRLHVAPQFVAILRVIFTVHVCPRIVNELPGLRHLPGNERRMLQRGRIPTLSSCPAPRRLPSRPAPPLPHSQLCSGGLRPRTVPPSARACHSPWRSGSRGKPSLPWPRSLSSSHSKRESFPPAPSPASTDIAKPERGKKEPREFRCAAQGPPWTSDCLRWLRA